MHTSHPFDGGEIGVDMSKKREQARDKRAANSETPARETAPVGNSEDSVPESGSGGRVGGLPRELGRYRLEKVLGEGAMGMVYLALDKTLHRRVALKIPKFKGEDDADQIKRFHREARAAAALHHRNICPVYDTGKIDGVRYISMSYIGGQPLDELIDPDELQPPQLVAVLVRKLALAMQKAHDAGVLHRDLKPSNIIIDNEGEPVLMDFGLAVRFGPSQQSRLTQSGTLLGTPAYMSPEQVEGNPAHIGPPADIYSLGVILYEMLTGDVPFGGSVAAVIGQIVTQQPLRPSELNPKVDRQLQSICLKAMAKQPDDRYESMGDMARALSAVSVASAPSSELKPQPITSADAPIVFDAPPVDSEDEFIEGRCGSCGMINDTSRNFCKACGSALMVPCLSCEVEIGSWEKFCPNCGSNVPDTLKARQSELDGLMESVRSLRDSHQFDEAIAEAKKFFDEEDARFSEYCEWATTTIQELETELKEWASTCRIAAGETIWEKQPVELDSSLSHAPRTRDKGQRLEAIASSAWKRQPMLRFAVGAMGAILLLVTVLTWIVMQTTAEHEVETIAAVPITDEPITDEPVTDEPVTDQAPGSEWDAYPSVSEVMAAQQSRAVKKHMKPAQLALGDPIVNSIGMVLVPIPAGQFQMGSPDSDNDAEDDQKPQHQVKITKPFYLAAYEVTQSQYEKVMGTRPWQGQIYVEDGPDNPATYVSHDDAVDFCRKLSTQEGVEYRLPTEAEWEYACRAGTTTIYSFGDDTSKLGQHAWYDKNAWNVDEKYAHGVGQKLPNRWGLFDMHGNVFEWCQDWHGDYRRGSVTDPSGASLGSVRVYRGGSWKVRLLSGLCHSANRRGTPGRRRHDLGFRVLRSSIK